MIFSLKLFFVLCAYVSLFCLGLSDNLRGPLYAEILNAYGLSQTQGSSLWATASFFGFFGSFFYPTLAKFWNFEKISSWTLLIIAFGFFLIGREWESFVWVLCGSAIFGLTLGIFGVHINVLIHQGVSVQEQAPYYSGLHSMYALSSLVAPLLIVVVTKMGGGWRTSFDLVAFFCVVVAVLFFIPASNQKMIPFFQKANQAVRASAPETNSKGSSLFFVILFALLLGGYVVAEIMISSRIATYLRQVQGLDLEASSYGSAAFFLGLFLFRAALFFYPLKWSSYRQLLISNVVSVILILCGILIHPYFLCATGVSMGLFYPMSIAYLSEKFPTKMSWILSKTQALQALMIAGMHVMMGILADQFGMRLSFIYGLTFLVISTVALLLFEKSHRKQAMQVMHA